MRHHQTHPHAECYGHLQYLECWPERVFDRREWVEVLRVLYQCEGCGDFVSVDRCLVDLPDGTMPMIEVGFKLS